MDSSVMDNFHFYQWFRYILYELNRWAMALQATAGDRLRSILNKFTSNPIMGVLAGMIVTI